MRFLPPLIGLLLAVLIPVLDAEAQRTKYKPSAYTRERWGRNNTNYSKSKAKFVCPIFDNSGYPYHGFGLKLGDPFALTYKFYPNKKYSFVLDFGKAASGLYSKYYAGLFETFLQDTLQNGESVEYFSHRVKSDIVAEFKILRNFDANKISNGLVFYVGAGVQLRSLEIEYNYFPSTGPTDPENIETTTRSRFTQGVEALIGIEYSYFSLPISAFMEIGTFTDVSKDPGYTRIQGGVGLRYIF
jgi:hypothetical protein